MVPNRTGRKKLRSILLLFMVHLLGFDTIPSGEIDVPPGNDSCPRERESTTNPPMNQPF
jgi:hypothetical protein